MTMRLFFESDALATEVTVLSCQPEGEQFATILQATIFHPQGGGQPSDTGWIGDSQVLRVVLQGQLTHYLDKPVALGTHQARIDSERRALNTRMHSAGHIIGNIGECLGWLPIKAHHWPGEGRVSFKRGENPQPIDIVFIQASLAQLISKNLPRQTQVQGDFREVGFGDLPAYACGGTHVKTLHELGDVVIQSISEKKGVMSINYMLS
ncbi:serine-tRNA(Ala) deacylase AlaX [Yersinia massiliensis]|uniref:Metal-dependent hydrolase related to alanyl-tRNA synthetase n=2 Tax=Yersinia TaxID=629 RepID=A0AAI8ZQE1_YERFR|nr:MULTISPECIES: serine-tRNA(Ala) deacylase AlaX [Yersinia]HEI6966496.1 serine-tRNA(Ala) deacylase AlaX [Yersinia enterocolitica]ATM85606.1 serine-tRNA(Ala) deacylase AlaX [Yersinia frederiksenii]MCB5315945.1 serine-tRNA(Ala) deacylase AlaX [Yersinia massiliensis]MDA5547289.1 serine-tRNA(Ala) deacylase AlaX [Yersinia massiliensis]MDN0125517.1 serine-tRNA(Ala) deacylase AlaX [Yersinia massiliensis]